MFTGVLTSVIELNKVDGSIFDCEPFIELEYTEEFERLISSGLSEDDAREKLFEFQSETILVGDWKKEERQYKPYKGETGYAAIYNIEARTMQIVLSNFVKKNCRLCSPCYPDQAELESDDGKYTGYALPSELIREEWQEEYGEIKRLNGSTKLLSNLKKERN